MNPDGSKGINSLTSYHYDFTSFNRKSICIVPYQLVEHNCCQIFKNICLNSAAVPFLSIHELLTTMFWTLVVCSLLNDSLLQIYHMLLINLRSTVAVKYSENISFNSAAVPFLFNPQTGLVW